MPQPLSRVAPNANVVIGNVGDYPLRRHPELALLAIEVIASWSNVEAFMLNVFVEMMGGPADTAATVFMALESQPAKSAAINAVADAELHDHHRDLLRVLLAMAKSYGKSRDKIAHWIWGDSPQLPDALLLANPKDRARLPLSREGILVYREPDFRTIIMGNERLAGFGLTFEMIIRGHVADRDGALYGELCAEPEIRERLGRPA